MKTHRIIAIVLALYTPCAIATNYDGHWSARIPVGDSEVQISLTIESGSYVMQYAFGNRLQRGEVVFTSSDTMHFIVQEFEPAEYQGEPLNPPPNSSFTIVEYDSQSMVLLDNVCAVTMGDQNCKLVWQRQ